MAPLAANLTDLLALTAPERFEAMGKWPRSTMSVPWIVVVPVVVAVVLAAVLLVVYRRWHARREMMRRFFETAERLGLTRSEQAVLMSIATLSGAARLNHVYLDERIFRRGVEAMARNEDVAAMGDAARKRLDRVVEALRTKIGLTPEASLPRRAPTAAAVLRKGDVVTLVRPDASGGVEATVSSIGHPELALVAVRAQPWRIGEACIIRQVYEGLHYELNASVSAVNDRLLIVRLIGEPRYVNLRRFLRTELDCPAYVARYSFTEEGAEPRPPEFVPGRLTEMGGPGLRIATPLKAQVGDRVLTVARTGEDRTVQGVGEVRRVSADGENADLAVELTGLTEDEIGNLVRDTNTAARRKARRTVEAEAAETN